ncbi:hypothetical protein [Blastococcus capsensis]|uniref:hypothetical protein n=1 Tax=Blastococcus capsensis TaxID=1564163 RepID=UPI00254170E2|nr:hypothetical protein [Blastococcus capsensis]MDK3257107.1 hypothetical protein [Blastococcus capsensis]
MTWLVIGGFAWFVVALTIAVGIGRSIRLADERDRASRLHVEVDRYLRSRVMRRQLVSAVPPSRAAAGAGRRIVADSLHAGTRRWNTSPRDHRLEGYRSDW